MNLSVLVTTGFSIVGLLVASCLVLMEGGGALLAQNHVLYFGVFNDVFAKISQSFILLSSRYFKCILITEILIPQDDV